MAKNFKNIDVKWNFEIDQYAKISKFVTKQKNSHQNWLTRTEVICQKYVLPTLLILPTEATSPYNFYRSYWLAKFDFKFWHMNLQAIAFEWLLKFAVEQKKPRQIPSSRTRVMITIPFWRGWLLMAEFLIKIRPNS